MSQENVEAFKRGLEAAKHRDFEEVLRELDPEVEWHPAIQMLLGGEETVYRGHEGVREMIRDTFEVFAEFDYEFLEIRDFGDRTVAIGHIRARGKESGAELESPYALMAEFKNGKVIRVCSYLDPNDALKAAGLSE